jgi:outer membrane protein assembly factor BamB
VRYLAALFMTSTMVVSIAAQPTGIVQWPRFRGLNGAGVADADKPPTTFGASTSLLWKTPMAPGHSSPIIWNDHVFLTAIDNGVLTVVSLRRRDGTERWRRTVPVAALEKGHRFSNPAASTPTTDGQRVYVYFASYGLTAYDFDGKELWKMPLPAPPIGYGNATSPIVFDGKVILQRDGNSTQSELLAVDGATGAVAWRTARPLIREGWSTPIIWSRDGVDEIVTSGTGRVVGYSSNGEERWWAAGLTVAPITLPVVGDGLLFASATYAGSPSDPLDIPQWDALVASYDADKDASLAVSEVPANEGIHLRKEVPKETPGAFLTFPVVLRITDANKNGIVTREEWDASLAFLKNNEDNLLAVRPGGSGNAASFVVWRANRGIGEMPSPLFYRGRLYFVKNGGMLTSYAPDSGKVVLDRQRIGTPGLYVASPIAADGRIYTASESGVVVVVRAGDTLDVLARNDLGESITATPAIAGNALYVRTAAHLWAFGGEHVPKP